MWRREDGKATSPQSKGAKPQLVAVERQTCTDNGLSKTVSERDASHDRLVKGAIEERSPRNGQWKVAGAGGSMRTQQDGSHQFFLHGLLVAIRGERFVDGNGQITTVSRRRFISSGLTTTTGRVLAISLPRVGSNCAQYRPYREIRRLTT